MKVILIRLLIAAFLTFAAFALSSSARGQQMEPAPDPVNQKAEQNETSKWSEASPETQASAAADIFSQDDDQTQDALVFTGQIARRKGTLILMDLVTRINYQLDDQTRARAFAGRHVKVVGKLEMRTNTIRVDTITITP